jgi:hypothetical protein
MYGPVREQSRSFDFGISKFELKILIFDVYTSALSFFLDFSAKLILLKVGD